MQLFDTILVETLNRYFNILGYTGYVKDSDTYKIIVLSFIEEFLNLYQGLITLLDYSTIENIVTCFANTSCLVPYGEYKLMSLPLTNYIYNIPIRISELGDIRHTERNSALRLTNL